MEQERTAFVIMQIGNPQMDCIYKDIYVPVLKSVHLMPKRIDQDNQGGLLKKEITDSIEKADIIIADISNERPNCYLEIGYAMGIDKYKNLIFTVREDHFPNSVKHNIDGPKVHFDLSGYDILQWDETELEEFKRKLTEKIERRLSIIVPSKIKDALPIWDETWLNTQRESVKTNLATLKLNRSFEALISVNPPISNLGQSKIVTIAHESQINTFGWPIAPIFPSGIATPPVPKQDGVVSEVKTDAFGLTYDFTYFRKNGQIFLSHSLFEDTIIKNGISSDIRIQRTTELLLFVSRYFTKCDLSPNSKIEIQIRYRGLNENTLMFGTPPFRSGFERKSAEEESYSIVITSLREIETNLPEIVKQLIDPLFVLFNFYEMALDQISKIVNDFVRETAVRHQ